MEANAEGLEGRPHRAEVLATFARPRQRKLGESPTGRRHSLESMDCGMA